jgi:predicted transcriptional regulator of viral defense system
LVEHAATIICWYIVSVTKATRSTDSIFRKRGGVLRMSEALAAGLNRRSLYALRDTGKITQLSRGVYRLASLPDLEAPDLVTVASRVPRGVVCLTSALAYHELTTQIPRAVDMALPRGAEKPRVDYPPVSFYWFSGAAFTSGIETHTVDRQKLRIYSAEKCVADAFKYRGKLGLDVALEALRTWRQRRGAVIERLLEQARTCRVERVMRPYLEALA